MSGIALTFFIVAAVLVWGGLIASIVFLARQPQLATYPATAELGDDE
ncbi:MetS family NSS transporter small subunit [Frigoribacterium sp. CG_9.8]|nr:MetS family NSS transporter small subunit [Frigoribacterium sp. CG_9.8]MBG6107998.1 hypothetical protein [Frigoribacterium sp. CG_9.8]